MPAVASVKVSEKTSDFDRNHLKLTAASTAVRRRSIHDEATGPTT